MKKTLNFKSDETKYILENTNPNEKREPFTIEKDTMEFDTVKFYEYVFSQIDGNKITDASLGLFRISSSYIKSMKKKLLNSSIFFL